MSEDHILLEHSASVSQMEPTIDEKIRDKYMKQYHICILFIIITLIYMEFSILDMIVVKEAKNTTISKKLESNKFLIYLSMGMGLAYNFSILICLYISHTINLFIFSFITYSTFANIILTVFIHLKNILTLILIIFVQYSQFSHLGLFYLFSWICIGKFFFY